MNNKEPRNVYILTNPSFCKDWVKIGKNSRPVDVHSKELNKELDNTSVACTRFIIPLCIYQRSTATDRNHHAYCPVPRSTCG